MARMMRKFSEAADSRAFSVTPAAMEITKRGAPAATFAASARAVATSSGLVQSRITSLAAASSLTLAVTFAPVAVANDSRDFS